MLLAVELKACECRDSPKEFRKRLLERLFVDFPKRSIDSLVCTPLDALEYCNMIREEVGSECLNDAVILKTLMNIRKRKDCPTGLKSKKRRQTVEQRLNDAGCDRDADEFKELVGDCLADMYKSQTMDEVLCHPREAKALCNYIRRRSRCSTLDDFLILSTLMNVRKKGP